jgi:hypothetical protein
MAAKHGRRRTTFFAMHCRITSLGGVLIMMGQHDRSEALFYYFRMEDQVPVSDSAQASSASLL